MTEVLGVMENAKSTPAFESVSAHMGVQPVSLHESVTASLPLLPVVLKLRTEKPKKGEHWKHYKERIADHLEPVRKKIATNMGMEATPLIAANALKFLGTEEQIKVLTNDSVIEKIEFDPLLQIVAMNDAILDISQPPFAQTHPGVDGSGVKVALLDSGVDTQHPYLSVAASVSTCGESFDIPGRHGTHCAGSIASKDTFYRGVAPGVTLFNVKVLQADGRGTHTNVVKGIDEALDLGAEVLSMSLGFNHLPTWSQGGHGWMCTNGHCPLCTAVDNAILLDNVIVVVAAGNEHARAEFLRTNGFGTSFDTELGCPGNSRQAITVGAITKVTFLPAPFSSRGPTSYNVRKPDIAAAGVNITSTVPIPRDPQGNPISNAARNDLFSRLSGTSMATPIVAGVVAVIVQQLKASGLAVTPAAVKSRLLSNGITTVSGATAFEVGGGRVNMQNL
ncbi:MAG: S8 family serine peptidase [Cyclobacteriaceae bacterium]